MSRDPVKVLPFDFVMECICVAVTTWATTQRQNSLPATLAAFMEDQSRLNLGEEDLSEIREFVLTHNHLFELELYASNVVPLRK